MIITQTPYRISFFGGGTDLPAWYRKYGGSVLSTTVNKYCYVTCRYLPPFFNHKHRIVYSKIEMPNRINQIFHPVVRNCLKHTGIEKGIEIYHQGDLPAWSGMGTSSSFTVGLLHALRTLQGEKMEKHDLALKAIHIEQNMIKDAVGSQDQTAVAFGGLNKIDFLPDDRIIVTPVSLPSERLKQFEDHLLLFFTGIIRKSSDIEKKKIRNFKSRKNELAKMYSMVEPAVKVLKDGNLNKFGEMLHESWLLKRSLSENVSNNSIDLAYNRARSAGAIGGKLLGAGGGGFMLLFVEPQKQRLVKKALQHLLNVPFKFESSGSQIIYNNPANSF